MDDKKFEEIVKEGIKAIPKRFLEKLNNVDICIEEEFPRSKGSLIFGLYEGIPQTERRHYAQVLPDKITIFKKPIEKVSCSPEEMKKIVTDTVWHEIAHHFGMDEKRVRDAEKKKTAF